jgi:glutamine synthetase
VVLNTIAAEALDEIASRLEKAKDVGAEIGAYVKEVMEKHGRIIFNGNGYSEDWVKEAEKRGLPNVRNTVDALKAYLTPKAQKLFDKYSVLAKEELHSRYDIYVEQYSKQINIEANTAVQMVRRQYIPAALSYVKELAVLANTSNVAKDLLAKVNPLIDSAYAKVQKLEEITVKAKETSDVTKQAEAYRDNVFTLCKDLRTDIDTLEKILPATVWPVPTYADMLFKL